MTGYNVEPVVASEGAVVEALEKYYAAAPSRRSETGPSALDMATRALEEMPDVGDAGDVEVLDELEEISAEALQRQGEDAPVIKLVNVILMSAIQKGASDIHIEPYEKEFRVRYRIDGILYNIMAPPMKYPRRDHVAHQDHVEARHRGEAPAAGRPHQDQLCRQRRGQGHRLPRQLPAHALRREDRHAAARQGQADARHDQARLRAGVAHQVRVRDLRSRGAWCWSPGRPAAARPTRSTRRSRASTRRTPTS